MTSTKTLFERIIREEYALTKQRQILFEFYGKDLYDPSLDNTYWLDDSDTRLQLDMFLRKIGAKPVKAGINIHQYQLDVTVTNVANPDDAKKEDRLWIDYPEDNYRKGKLWSTSTIMDLYYAWDSGKSRLNLYSADDYSWDHYQGYIDDQAVYHVETHKDPSKEELTGYDKVSEVGHTILNWAGFIPVIGDIVDGVNAIWYLTEAIIQDDTEKYWEAAFSAIAIIPIIGSAIVTPIRLAIKPVRSWFFKLIRRNDHNVWTTLVKQGNLKPEMLKALGEGFVELEKLIKGGGKKNLDSQSMGMIDRLRSTLKTQHGTINKALRELEQSAARGADDLASARGALNTTVRNTGQTVTDKVSGIINQYGSKLYLPTGALGKGLRRIPKLSQFATKKSLAIAKSIEKQFTKDISNPDKLAGILNTMSDRKGVLNTDIIPNIKSNPAFARIVANSGIFRVGANAGTKNIGDLFRQMQKADPKSYENIVGNVAQQAMKNDSVAWSLYRQDAKKTWKATFNAKNMMQELGTFGDNSLRKWVDIIYQELSDVGEDIALTPEEQDNPTAVIYPILKKAVELASFGAISPEKVQTQYKEFIQTNPLAGAALSTLGYKTDKDTGAIYNTGDMAYNPYDEAGGVLR